tara:strand:+ start:39 stop:419 length:381 start_codon:yes stop_codon:yes gene_type:complete
MHLEPQAWVRVSDGEEVSLDAWSGGSRVHAVAAIGNPDRFFKTLRTLGLDPVEHPFPDHHPLDARDLTFDDALPVVMTEKDAVKCSFALPHAEFFYLQVSANVPSELTDEIIARLDLHSKVSVAAQ